MSTFVCFWFKPRGFESYSNKPAKYTAQHVNILYNMLQRHGNHHLICVTDYEPNGLHWMIEAVQLPYRVQNATDAYYPKLWMWSEEFGRLVGERFTYIDLDVVITNNPDRILKEVEQRSLALWDFAKGGDIYNTSLVTMEPGIGREVWNDFCPEVLKLAQQFYKEKGYRWTGDQSFVSYVLGKGCPTISEGSYSGVYKWRAKEHVSAPPPNHIMSFTCGPGTPLDAAKHCQWINEAYL